MEVKLVSHYEVGVGRFGEIVHLDKKTHAVLSIVREDHIDPEEPLEHSEELTIVHELLHLHLCLFASPAEDSPEGIALEKTVHALSRALLCLKRGAAN